MQITWEFLRSIGFRFTSSSVDRVPHMVCSLHQNQEVGLEVSPNSYRGSQMGDSWFVWLRSDLAHSKCRFCFIRHVDTEEQIIRLMESITDMPVVREEFDAEQFAESLAREREDCLRRFREYLEGNRFSRIPGGL